MSEIAIRNGGTFRLDSGDAGLIAYQRRGTRRTDFEAHRPWTGTIVSILFNLENLLPMSEVYRSLPLPDGYEGVDFFDA